MVINLDDFDDSEISDEVVERRPSYPQPYNICPNTGCPQRDAYWRSKIHVWRKYQARHGKNEKNREIKSIRRKNGRKIRSN